VNALFSPAYSVTIGNQRWTEQALLVEIGLHAAPLVDAAEIVFPAAAPLEAAPGDDVTIHLDSGEIEADVFSGQISSIERSLDRIRVRALDGGGILARLRLVVTYEKVSAGTAIRNLCSEAGVDVGSVDDGVDLAFYAVDDQRSALVHIARLAGFSGALASITADGALQAPVVDPTQAERALRFGREILGISQRRRAAPVTDFVVAGEAGAGSSSAPEALRPTSDFFAGNKPAEASATARWRWEPALRTVQGAERAGAAWKRRYAARAAAGEIEAYLQPDLRPGSVIEVQDLPAGLEKGPLLVEHVRHRLSARGAVTTLGICIAGADQDPAGLLGSLAGAVGGLL
jgi:hypothetical protein